MKNYLRFFQKLKPLLIVFFITLTFLWVYWLSSPTLSTLSAQETPPSTSNSAAPAVVGAKVASQELGLSGKLAKLIAKTPVCSKTLNKGCIDLSAPKGYLGIPGAPKPNLIIALLWGIWVGWIFSTVGAFGGIMAGVGHITIFGLGNYASTFKKTSPALNKFLTDTIRVSNMFLVI